MRVTGVSFSSDKKLSRCEQQYSYRYDEKLKKRVKSKGLYMGDFMHQLIEEYRRRNDWRNKFVEIKKKLWDGLFDEEKEGYEEDGFTPKIAHGLMTHYVERWGDQDSKLVTVALEKDYEIMTKYGFPVRFKSDWIARDKKTILLFENKNKKEIPNSDERILSPQVHAYCFLLSKVGIKIDRIVWDYIRTEKVSSPSLNKDGSISKRKISTDRRTYLQFLKENKIKPKTEDERQGIENVLQSLPEDLTLERVMNIPNLKIGEMFVKDWVERARRAQKIVRPLRTWQRDCSWMCDYYHLCEADMLGKPDRNTIIKKDFVTSIKSAETK